MHVRRCSGIECIFLIIVILSLILCAEEQPYRVVVRCDGRREYFCWPEENSIPFQCNSGKQLLRDCQYYNNTLLFLRNCVQIQWIAFVT